MTIILILVGLITGRGGVEDQAISSLPVLHLPFLFCCFSLTIKIVLLFLFLSLPWRSAITKIELLARCGGRHSFFSFSRMAQRGGWIYFTPVPRLWKPEISCPTSYRERNIYAHPNYLLHTVISSERKILPVLIVVAQIDGHVGLFFFFEFHRKLEYSAGEYLIGSGHVQWTVSLLLLPSEQTQRRARCSDRCRLLLQDR